MILAALALGTAAGAWAQSYPGAAGIYTCIDSRGRRLTSDRPIQECLDREQRELNPSGTVRRTVPPSLSAVERAAQEERDRKAAEERQREADERRLNRVLVSRYPNSATHGADRAKALQTVQEAIEAGQRRVVELQEQRKKLVVETEFYKSAEQWPAKLKRQLDENEQQLAAQQRFVATQEEEKKRINTRFDDELAKLKRLWAVGPAAAASP
jgi:predicted RNase H-like HicB family nuclease